MGNALRNADIADNPDVAAAQRKLDDATQTWIDLGVEAGLLVASSVPGVGWVADSVSLAKSVAEGDVGGAIIDAIGFIPFGGDLVKGFFRGRRIKRAMRAADEALDAARTGLSRAQEFARRRMASSQYWGAIKRRRNRIIKKYEGCRKKECADSRDKELESETKLPSRDKGDWVDENDNRVPAGQGIYKPKPGTRLYDTLSKHQNPVAGIPYANGQPDLSGFPPTPSSGWLGSSSNAAPDGKAYSVEVEQSLTGDRMADASAAWKQRAEDYPGTPKPENGQWHHTGDGVTMWYVDKELHGALAHQGSVSMNTSPDF